MLLLLLPFSAWAEPAEVTGEPIDETLQETQPEQETTEPELELEPEQLRSRKIGAAFENFQPSEEISADNAVSFPVDI